MSQVTELKSHSLVSHHLAALRSQHTDHQHFRETAQRLSRLVLSLAAHDMDTVSQTVTTPLQTTDVAVLSQEIWFIPVLRAGLAMVEPGLDIIPQAHVGFIGLYRDETTLEPKSYYKNIPDLSQVSHHCFLMDPMLATGGSAVAALDLIKAQGGSHIQMVNLIAAPEGIRQVHAVHPDVPIVTAAIDDGLNEQGYIVPGLGDAGDRYFGSETA